MNILSNKFVLWSKDDSTPPHDVCPAVLPFRLQFPETFTEDRRTFKLPPSFEATFLSVPIVIARCIYTLRLVVTFSRQYGLASWASTKSYSLPLDYRPRARARHAPNITNSVFDSVKTQPDEWIQLCSRMDVRPNPEVEPIDCHASTLRAMYYSMKAPHTHLHPHYS
ncbi:hypothetical protein DXG03_003164 [Asterophora parasitica]|uniref:Uncharacterized protein n=1 Tax=Asterophora parasitica TaxID=117018 RepID=A0A9P7KFH2_9AGAR|nr:hypothetical protein DXG03_003164 [Asterophora parasitica]